MNLLVYLGVGVVALGAVAYWWMRPVTWRDGEGTLYNERNDWTDTDTGSLIWYLRTRTDDGRALGFLLGVRDWWENERRRWRR